MLDALSPEITFRIFACGCAVALLFVKCCLPETKSSTVNHHGLPADKPAGTAVHPPAARRALLSDFDQGIRPSEQLFDKERDSDEEEWSTLRAL